jgi:hypothetical protein
MPFVRVSADYGVVVRKAALAERGVSMQQLLDAMEAGQPLDESADLVSFGPHFGSEASDELSRRLRALGLEYVDDFFVFAGEFPNWCRFGAALEPGAAEF